MASVPQIWNVEALNENSQRRFPLFEGASQLDITGSVKIPTNFLVDMILPVHAGLTVDPTKFHLKTLTVLGTGVTAVFGYDGTAIASFSLDATTFTPNQTLALEGTGDFFDSEGKVVVGSIVDILSLAGEYEFDVAGAQLETHVIVPDLRGVSALFIKNGDEVSGPFDGDITLEAGNNFAIAFQQRSGTAVDPHILSFSAIDGAGLNTDCACDENRVLPCIKTINGIEPDTAFNFTVLESECIKLEAIANGIQIKDPCSTPCCGCQELDIVKQTLERVVTQVNSLSNLASQLEGAINNLTINLLA